MGGSPAGGRAFVTEYVKVLKEVYVKLFFVSKEFFVKRRVARRERHNF